MKDLDIINLYQETSQKELEEFQNTTTSNAKVKMDLQKTIYNTEWMEMIQSTLRYIDNILKSPNRFIINDEELVKIELAKRIGVESIKHLSKHTNFIQEIDAKTGDVTPSKILNVNKEESFATYENRFIYTLIKTIKMFIERKKEQYQTNCNNLDYMNDKKIEYNGTAKIENERINTQFIMSSTKEIKAEQTLEFLEQMNDLSKEVDALMTSDLFITLDKQKISLVKSPIKKTNMILKNVNFQYAVKLWDYLQTHVDDDSKKDKKHDNYEDQGILKKLANDIFYLQYVALSTLDEEKKKESTDKIKNEMTDNLIEQIIQMNPDLQLEEIEEKIKRKYEVVKYRNLVTTAEIQKIFKKHMEKFMQKNNLK